MIMPAALSRVHRSRGHVHYAYVDPRSHTGRLVNVPSQTLQTIQAPRPETHPAEAIIHSFGPWVNLESIEVGSVSQAPKAFFPYTKRSRMSDIFPRR